MTYRTIGRLALGMALAVVGGGCGKEVPTSEQASGSTHCVRYYAQCIDPIFHAALPGTGLSCSGQGLGCHVIVDTGGGTQEGSGGRFKVYRFPADDSQHTSNFISAHNMTLAGAASLLLTKPLAESAGGVSHGGGELFANTSDPDYLHIRFWAESVVDDPGNLDQALDSAQCTALFVGGNTCRTFP
jgi:hypothetical protein